MYWVKLIIIIVALILIAVILNIAYIRTDKALDRKNTLRIPLFYRAVPIAVCCEMITMGVYFLIFQFEDFLPYIIIAGIICLPFLIMFITWSLWKVEIQDDGFVYRNFFGREAEYKYTDLEYEDHPKGLKWFFLKNGKKVLCIAFYVANGHVLYKRYRKAIKNASKNFPK